jgi:hypothetical protein
MRKMVLVPLVFTFMTMLPPSTGVAQSVRLPVAVADLDLQLGAGGEDGFAFGRIPGVAVAPDGSIHILEAQEHRVTVVDASGRARGSYGRRGQGPGEFMSPGGIGQMGDTTWVVDPAGRRISHFRDGALVGTSGYGSIPLEGREYVVSVVPLESGAVMAFLMRRSLGPAEPPDYTGRLVRVDPEVPGRQHLAWLEESYPLRIRIGTALTTPYLIDHPIHRVSRDGSTIVVVERPFPDGAQARTRVTLMDSSGDTIYSRVLPSPAIPIPSTFWDARWAERERALPESPVTRAQFDRASRLPTAFAPASAVHVGGDRSVWIAGAEVPDRTTRAWTVLDAEGNERFAVDLPSGFRVHHASEKAVWGVGEGELGVATVERYSLRQP